MSDFDLWNSEASRDQQVRANEQAAAWRSKIIGWLLVANIGAFGLMGSFAAQMENPYLALRALAPSFWLFLAGAILAALAALLTVNRYNKLSRRAQIRARTSYARHLAKKNQQKYEQSEKSASREKELSVQIDNAHSDSQRLQLFSALLLLFGFIFPLVHVSLGWSELDKAGKSVAPKDERSAAVRAGGAPPVAPPLVAKQP